MSVSADVIVVGAGPGGIAAATVAAEAGQRVCLIDDNATPGGQIWRAISDGNAHKYPHGQSYRRWIERLKRTNCDVWAGWEVIDQPAKRVLRLQREGECRDIAFRNLILATGARERFLPFPQWTLSGVTGAGGLQALVKNGLDARGKRVVVAGTGPLLLAIAAGLADAGAKIVAIHEQAPAWRLMAFGLALARYPGKLLEGARYRQKLLGVPYRTGCWVKRADGTARVERVTVTDGQREWRLNCDWLACGYHLVPNLELPRLLGCQIENGYVLVDSLQRSSVDGVACIGELTGIGGLEKALVEGEIAGWLTAGREAEARALNSRVKRMRRFAERLDRTFTLRDELRAMPSAETLVCRCEDVSHADLKECGSWREAKLHTRCGMGPCQGRVCGPATEFFYGWKCGSVRQPLFPAEVSTVAAKVDCPEPIHL